MFALQKNFFSFSQLDRFTLFLDPGPGCVAGGVTREVENSMTLVDFLKKFKRRK